MKKLNTITNLFLNGMTTIIGGVLLSSTIVTKLFSQATTMDWILYSICLLFVWAHWLNSKRLKKQIEELNNKLFVDENKLESDFKEVFLITLSRRNPEIYMDQGYVNVRKIFYDDLTQLLFSKDYTQTIIKHALDTYLDKYMQQNIPRREHY